MKARGPSLASSVDRIGQPISSFQAIQHILADMATQTEAARALVYASARMVDSGAKSVAKESAMAKLFASDTAMKVTVDAVQVLGGAGVLASSPVDRLYRSVRALRIYEGTTEIQHLVIAGQLLAGEGAA